MTSDSVGEGFQDRGATVVQILPGENITWVEGPFNYITYLGVGNLGWCTEWRSSQHLIFQLVNAFFLLAYAIPSTKYGIIAMHSILIVAFMVFSGWAWAIVCAPDMFIWNLCYSLMNAGQLVFLLYQMRPVKFDPELEEVYHTLFFPFKVTRTQFKKLMSPNNMAQVVSLHAGEAYALQNLTRTDRLGLLLSGKLNVLCDSHFLHPILACEFLDSPEFESRANYDDTFKVSIVAATSCRYVYWQRSSLEYLFAKETYLGTVMATLIARDIATKLYAMNNKIVTEKGVHLDIRLPCITSSLTTGDNKSPTVKALRKHTALLSGVGRDSPDTLSNSRENLVRSRTPYPGESNGYYPSGVPNGRVAETVPLTESQSHDELGSSYEVESWLESSSKYHSCEVVDD